MNDGPGVIETCEAVREGRLEAGAAVEACWLSARAREPALHAFAYLPDTKPEAGVGPLAGVAVGVKDLLDTADMPTAYGAAVHAGNRPEKDATIVAWLRERGATILGKTVTTEFAYRHPGATRNPRNLDHTPGGSSSGSVAAVAAGLVPLALGTQTMGSIIRPAAFCGIVGYKPTFGTLPRVGAHPLCDALDHIGLFARSVADIAAVMRLLRADRFSTGAPSMPRPLTLGLLPLTDPTITPAQKTATEAAVTVIRAAGHAVESVEPPAGYEEFGAVTETLVAGEAVRHFGALVERYGEAVSPPTRALLEQGRSMAPRAYDEAVARQSALRDICARAFAGFDALLTIPAAGEAPEGLDWTGDPRFCVPWTCLGVPALTFPIATGPAALPLGLQVVGHSGEDAALLAVGGALASLFPPVRVAPA